MFAGSVSNPCLKASLFGFSRCSAQYLIYFPLVEQSCIMPKLRIVSDTRPLHTPNPDAMEALLRGRTPTMLARNRTNTIQMANHDHLGLISSHERQAPTMAQSLEKLHGFEQLLHEIPVTVLLLLLELSARDLIPPPRSTKVRQIQQIQQIQTNRPPAAIPGATAAQILSVWSAVMTVLLV